MTFFNGLSRATAIAIFGMCLWLAIDWATSNVQSFRYYVALTIFGQFCGWIAPDFTDKTKTNRA